MIKALLNRLSGHQPFAQHELHLKYKVDFLNSVFLLATVVAFGMGFYRWQYSPLMGAIDFGFSLIGLAALYYLKRHREQVEFVSTVAIVQGIIALSKAFERSVVAEGVETDAHYQTLLQMGCEIGQGYDIARPMPASAVPAWLLASGAVA